MHTFSFGFTKLVSRYCHEHVWMSYLTL